MKSSSESDSTGGMLGFLVGGDDGVAKGVEEGAEEGAVEGCVEAMEEGGELTDDKEEKSEAAVSIPSWPKSSKEGAPPGDVVPRSSVELFPKMASFVKLFLNWFVAANSATTKASITATVVTATSFSFFRLIITASSGATLARIKEASKIKFSAPLVPIVDTLAVSLTSEARGTKMILLGAVGS